MTSSSSARSDALSPFRQKQAALAKLAPPSIGRAHDRSHHVTPSGNSDVNDDDDDDDVDDDMDVPHPFGDMDTPLTPAYMIAPGSSPLSARVTVVPPHPSIHPSLVVTTERKEWVVQPRPRGRTSLVALEAPTYEQQQQQLQAGKATTHGDHVHISEEEGDNTPASASASASAATEKSNSDGSTTIIARVESGVEDKTVAAGAASPTPPPPSSTGRVSIVSRFSLPRPSSSLHSYNFFLPLRELPSSISSRSFWPDVSPTDLLSIRRRFLSVLVSLLHSHRAFTCLQRKGALDRPGGSGSQQSDEDELEVKFQNEAFLKYVHRDYKPFLHILLDTQMFKVFNEERIMRESCNTNQQHHHTSAASSTEVSVSSTSSSSSSSSSHGSSSSSSSSSSGISSSVSRAPLDWFDRLCHLKRDRMRMHMSLSGESGKTGLLYKLGRKVPNWRQRYFELNRHGTILRYYAYSEKMIALEPEFRELKKRSKLNPRDANAKANLDRLAEQREKLRASLYRGELTLLPGQTQIFIPTQPRKYMTPYVFEVVTPTRSLLACAPDLASRDEWITVIRARAAKLSIDHMRMSGVQDGGDPTNHESKGLMYGLGSVPHLESRLQMQLRLLREKNINNLTKSFMENLAKQQAKASATAAEVRAKDTSKQTLKPCKGSSAGVDVVGPLGNTDASSAMSSSSTTSSSSSSTDVVATLPHALMVCEHLRTSLELRKFTYLFRSYPHCFSGRDAAHYILHQNFCLNLKHCRGVCDLMLQHGLIIPVNVSRAQTFQVDHRSMYTFPKQSLLHAGLAHGDSDPDAAANRLPTEEERVIVARMREELDVRDRVQGLFRTTVKDCFTAKAAITWLLDRGICSNESAALRLATRLVRTGLILPVVSTFGGMGVSSTTSPSEASRNKEVENNLDLYRFHAAVGRENIQTGLEATKAEARPLPKTKIGNRK